MCVTKSPLSEDRKESFSTDTKNEPKKLYNCFVFYSVATIASIHQNYKSVQSATQLIKEEEDSGFLCQGAAPKTNTPKAENNTHTIHMQYDQNDFCECVLDFFKKRKKPKFQKDKNKKGFRYVYNIIYLCYFASKPSLLFFLGFRPHSPSSHTHTHHKQTARFFPY